MRLLCYVHPHLRNQGTKRAVEQFSEVYMVERWQIKDLNHHNAAHKNPYSTLHSPAGMNGLGKLRPGYHVPP